MVDGVKRMDVAEGAEAAPSSDLVFSMQRPRRFLLTRGGCGRGCDIKRRFHIPTSLCEEQLRLLGGDNCSEFVSGLQKCYRCGVEITPTRSCQVACL